MKRLSFIVSSTMLVWGAAASAQVPPSSEVACRRAVNLCADGAYRDRGFRTSGECFDYYTAGLDCPPPEGSGGDGYTGYWTWDAEGGCASRIVKGCGFPR
jgi:hypothetical protein